MKLEIHHHHYQNTAPELTRQLGRIEQALNVIIEKGSKMALDFARLETEVSENSSVIQSAILLLQQVADAIRDAAADQAKVVALADSLDAQSNALAVAVAANTPGTPTPGPAPTT
jgi:antirestriction protein ArdC